MSIISIVTIIFQCYRVYVNDHCRYYPENFSYNDENLLVSITRTRSKTRIWLETKIRNRIRSRTRTKATTEGLNLELGLELGRELKLIYFSENTVKAFFFQWPYLILKIFHWLRSKNWNLKYTNEKMLQSVIKTIINSVTILLNIIETNTWVMETTYDTIVSVTFLFTRFESHLSHLWCCWPILFTQWHFFTFKI